MNIFFDGLDDDLLKGCDEFSSLGHQMSIYRGGRLPDWSEADIAIFSLSERRGQGRNAIEGSNPDILRRAIYRLRSVNPSAKIVDLGALRPGEDLEATYHRLREVCQMLMDSGTLPFIIGASHDHTYGQYLAHEAEGKQITLGIIDSSMDMLHDERSGMSSHHLYKILSHTPNYLSNICHLGYQSFLVENDFIDILEKLNFESYRLGEVRERLKEMEPVIRSCEMLSFDLAAIRKRDAQASPLSTFYGLEAEEACQLAYYAGWSDRLSSFGLYGYDPDSDKDGQTAEMLAAVIWYFFDGYYSRVDEGSVNTDAYTSYSVEVEGSGHSITFYKSERSERWWMEVEKTNGSKTTIPCSYQDYLDTAEGHLPDRFVQAMARAE